MPILIIGIKSIENYGKKYKDEFDSIFLDLAKEFELFLYPDFMAPIVNKGNDLSSYLQNDMLHPNERGVELIVKGILPTFIDFIEDFTGTSSSSEK